MARRLARAKALAVAARYPALPVLAADTVVVFRGRLLGKPADEAEAWAMLRGLRGRWHRVITAVALARDGRTRVDHAVTQVRMREYSDEEIAASIARGDPFDKAGAYAIQDECFRPVAEYRGWIDLVGGNVDPAAHLVDGVPDPVRAVLQEVQEELGVRAEDVERVVCLGLARNTRTGKPELIFATALAASSELFLQTGPTPEHRQMVALPADPEAVRDFLRRARRVTPSAQAGLTLWCDAAGQSVG